LGAARETEQQHAPTGSTGRQTAAASRSAASPHPSVPNVGAT
jgi:hypothetical protein